MGYLYDLVSCPAIKSINETAKEKYQGLVCLQLLPRLDRAQPAYRLLHLQGGEGAGEGDPSPVHSLMRPPGCVVSSHSDFLRLSHSPGKVRTAC